MTRHMLYSNEMDTIVSKHLKTNSDWVQMEATVAMSTLPDGLNVIYFYNKSKNAVIIPSPLAVKDSTNDEAEPSYDATIKAISASIGDAFVLSTSLVGKGASERHYTALYRSLDGKISIFDSKTSNPQRFLNSSDDPGFFEKIWGGFTALFAAFGLWAFGIGKRVHATFLNQDVSIHRLGTQPLFDGVSCGLHSTGAVLAMADLIDNDITDHDKVITSITNSTNLDERAETILNNDVSLPLVSSALGQVSKPQNKSVSHDIEDKPENQDNVQKEPQSHNDEAEENLSKTHSMS